MESRASRTDISPALTVILVSGFLSYKTFFSIEKALRIVMQLYPKKASSRLMPSLHWLIQIKEIRTPSNALDAIMPEKFLKKTAKIFNLDVSVKSKFITAPKALFSSCYVWEKTNSCLLKGPSLSQ